MNDTLNGQVLINEYQVRFLIEVFWRVVKDNDLKAPEAARSTIPVGRWLREARAAGLLEEG